MGILYQEHYFWFYPYIANINNVSSHWPLCFISPFSYLSGSKVRASAAEYSGLGFKHSGLGFEYNGSDHLHVSECTWCRV